MATILLEEEFKLHKLRFDWLDRIILVDLMGSSGKKRSMSWCTSSFMVFFNVAIASLPMLLWLFRQEGPDAAAPRQVHFDGLIHNGRDRLSAEPRQRGESLERPFVERCF